MLRSFPNVFMIHLYSDIHYVCASWSHGLKKSSKWTPILKQIWYFLLKKVIHIIPSHFTTWQKKHLVKFLFCSLCWSICTSIISKRIFICISIIIFGNCGKSIFTHDENDTINQPKFKYPFRQKRCIFTKHFLITLLFQTLNKKF